MSLFNCFKEYTLYIIVLLFFVSFTSFGQEKPTPNSGLEVIFPKNPNNGIVPVFNDSRQYIFEVEDFPIFYSQIKSFTKHLEKVVAFNKIFISKDKGQLTVFCSGKNGENFLYKLKKILHDDGFRLYKYKEESLEESKR